MDITNPAARKWYENKLGALVDLGVDCFKVETFASLIEIFRVLISNQTDFGERIPHVSVTFNDGSDPMRMHNTYSVLYNKMVFEYVEKRLGKGEAVVFARASTVGGQRYASHRCWSNRNANEVVVVSAASLW